MFDLIYFCSVLIHFNYVWFSVVQFDSVWLNSYTVTYHVAFGSIWVQCGSIWFILCHFHYVDTPNKTITLFFDVLKNASTESLTKITKTQAYHESYNKKRNLFDVWEIDKSKFMDEIAIKYFIVE